MEPAQPTHDDRGAFAHEPSRVKASLVKVAWFAAVTCIPLLIGYGWCITGYGWQIAPMLDLLFMVPMIALLVGVVALAALPFRRFRPWAKDRAIVGCGLFLVVIPVARTAVALRRHGFALAAERAQPLVAAIERYARERGQPPPGFVDLIPDYLAAIPEGLPPLRLLTGDDTARMYRGNDWVLTADVSTGILNFDRFLYYPNQDYPGRSNGDGFERIGDWVYVHD